MDRTKQVGKTSGRPALLGLVERRWLDQASREFAGGKPQIYFGTNSTRVAPASRHVPSYVYFKPIGSNQIEMRAEFIEMTTVNMPEKRLQGSENEAWERYYGFRNLTHLNAFVPVTSLRSFSTKKPLRNDVPSSCLIEDPDN